MTDIDRARIVYSLLAGLINGDSIELLSDKLSQSIKIPASPNMQDNPDSLLIRSFQELYTDLSDIETIFNVKLSVPKKITSVDQNAIRQLSEFIRGFGSSEPYLITTFSNTETVRSRIFMKGYSKIIISDVFDEINIFGKMIKVPFVIEGLDLLLVNEDEIRASIERRDHEFRVVWRSDTGKLYKKFDPDPLTAAKLQQQLLRRGFA